MSGKRDKHNRALDMYQRLKALMDRAHLVVHGPYTQTVLVEFKEPRDAAMLHELLAETKAEAKAERKADG